MRQAALSRPAGPRPATPPRPDGARKHTADPREQVARDWLAGTPGRGRGPRGSPLAGRVSETGCILLWEAESFIAAETIQLQRKLNSLLPKSSDL